MLDIDEINALVSIAVNDAIFPVPLDAKPMAVLLLLQLYTVPDTGPMIVIKPVLEPVQTLVDDGLIELTDGNGLTVIVNI